MMNFNQYPALLLNADFIPVSVFPLKTLTWQDALRGVFLDKLVTVAEYDAEVSSQRETFRLPSVVALKDYKKIPRVVPFTRSNIWLRDNGQCVYCKIPLSTSELTFDHVVPRSRGGDLSWENIVCACTSCNHKKANRTPKESGMHPFQVPRRPSQFELSRKAEKLLHSAPAPQDWIDFIYWKGELND